MEKKLYLDESKIKIAREKSKNIADNVLKELSNKSTVSIERAICRMLGFNGYESDTLQPHSNIIVDYLKSKNLIEYGVIQFLAQVCKRGVDLISVPQRITHHETLEFDPKILLTSQECTQILKPYIKRWFNQVETFKTYRNNQLQVWGDKSTLSYVIVATGNIYEDTKQAIQAVQSGADVIAVIRSSGQSLLDYVPVGETTEGYGGTYATKENFELMRSVLNEEGKRIGRYIRLCNYCSGLCMPEMAVLGSECGLDVMLNDALYGILFRDINMERTLIDQHFSRQILALSGIIINTGEDNYLTTADAVESAHTVLTSDFINQAMAHNSGLKNSQLGLGHAFEMNPDISGGFLLELSQALLIREIFDDCPVKYMPPTKFITGDIFKATTQNVMFNLVSSMTNQSIHLLGMMTEGIHTPFPSDRALALDNFNYVYNNTKGLLDEVSFKKDGIIVNRASKVLDDSLDLLSVIETEGLFNSITKGVFADISRKRDGGKGLDGVFTKNTGYINCNVFWEDLE